MGTLSRAIENYIASTIRYSNHDRDKAIKSREWFLNRIKQSISKQSYAPQLYERDKIVYFGSYFKGTKVRAVDEFDVLIVLDSCSGYFFRDGITYGKGLGTASPNYLFDKRFYKLDETGISPTKLLNWLQRLTLEIVNSFDGEAPERNGQAITATIKSQNLKIDLVPAVICENMQSNTPPFYVIPKGDNTNSWLVTRPREDINLLQAIAQDKANFRNIIRIIKRIKSTYNFQLSSFAIETAIIKYGKVCAWHDDVATNLKAVISDLSQVISSGYLKDPFDNVNLLEGISSLSWYAQRLNNIKQELDTLSNITYEQPKLNQLVEKLFENN